MNKVPTQTIAVVNQSICPYPYTEANLTIHSILAGLAHRLCLLLQERNHNDSRQDAKDESIQHNFHEQRPNDNSSTWLSQLKDKPLPRWFEINDLHQDLFLQDEDATHALSQSKQVANGSQGTDVSFSGFENQDFRGLVLGDQMLDSKSVQFPIRKQSTSVTISGSATEEASLPICRGRRRSSVLISSRNDNSTVGVVRQRRKSSLIANGSNMSSMNGIGQTDNTRKITENGEKSFIESFEVC